MWLIFQMLKDIQNYHKITQKGQIFSPEMSLVVKKSCAKMAKIALFGPFWRFYKGIGWENWSGVRIILKLLKIFRE